MRTPVQRLMSQLHMEMERPMEVPGSPRILAEFLGREVVFGPIHSDVRISVTSRGITIDRLGFLRPLAAKLPKQFRFSDLHSDGQTIYLNDESGTHASRLVVGRAVPIIHEILGILDRDRHVPLVAFAGSGITQIGMPVPGTVLLGANGLMLVPRAFPSARSLRRFHHPLDHLHAVRAMPGGLELLVARFSEPRFQVFSEDLTPRQFGDWWSHVFRTPTSTSMERLPVLWLTEGGLLSKADLNLIPGGIHINSATGPMRAIESAGVHVEVERWATTSSGVVRGELRIRGQTHKIWMLGGKGDYNILSQHLRKSSKTIWGNDVEVRRWRRCEGRWNAARLVVRGETEVLLDKVEVEVTTSGFKLHHHEPELTEALERLGGRRMELQLESNLVKLAVRVVHQGEAETEDHAADRSWPFTQALYPLGAGPNRVSPGQNAFEADSLDPDMVAIFLPRTLREVCGHLANLSATGASVLLETTPTLRGSVVRLAMGAGSGQEMRLQGEVTELKRDPDGGCTLQMSFTALDEKLRARLQREVLRFERDAIRAREAIQQARFDAVEDTNAA
jgi:hypothetical protein